MTGTERKTVHRTAAVRSYKGHNVHAAPGVHEYAVELARAALPERRTDPRGRRRLRRAGAPSPDAGFEVVPTDLDPPHDWIHRLDLDEPRAGPTSTRGPFDMVVCVETLEHVENPRKVLRSIRSMLRPGDRLLVSTPNIAHPHSRLKMFLRGAPYFFGPTHYYQPGHISMLPDWMLTEHVRLAGFDRIEVTMAGDTEYHGLRRLAHRIEIALLRAIGCGSGPDSGEGVCTFVTAVAV